MWRQDPSWAPDSELPPLSLTHPTELFIAALFPQSPAYPTGPTPMLAGEEQQTQLQPARAAVPIHVRLVGQWPDMATKPLGDTQ